MDDLELVRAFRADAPKPGRDQLAPARQQLLATAAGGGQRARLSGWSTAGRRLAMAGTVVAVSAAMVLGSQGFESEPSGRRGNATVPPPLHSDRSSSPQAILERAARTVAERPVPVPRADQWIYFRQTFLVVGKHPATTVEDWEEYGDPKTGVVQGDNIHSWRDYFNFLSGLEGHSGEAVKEKARAFVPQDPTNKTAIETDLEVLALLAQAQPSHPQGLAAVYRALATVPGVKADTTKDSSGRRVIVVYVPGAGRHETRAEILIDARTYRYAGMRWVAGPPIGPTPYASTRHYQEELLQESALVDNFGDRP